MLDILVTAAVALGFSWLMYYAIGAVAGSIKNGLGMIVVTFMITTALSGSQGLQIGISIYPDDVVCTVIFLAAIARYLMNFKFLEWRRFIAWFAMALCFSSFIRGVFAVGLRDAGVLARGPYYSFSVLLYVLSFDIREQEWHDILKAVRWMTIGIMAIALVRWAMVGAGLASASSFETEASAAEGGLRVVPSICALVIAESFLIESFYLKQRQQNRWSRLVPLALILSVVLLQHRTLWVGLIAPICWLGFKDRNFRRYALVIFTVGFLGIMAVLTTNIAPTVRDALTLSAVNDSTLLWRFSSWKTSIDNWSNSDALSHLIGIPFGIANARVLDSGELTDRATHDYLVDVLLRLGLAGLATIIIILVEPLRRSIKSIVTKAKDENDSRIMIALMLLILGYSITYAPDDFQMAMIGAMMAYNTSHKDLRPTGMMLDEAFA